MCMQDIAIYSPERAHHAPVIVDLFKKKKKQINSLPVLFRVRTPGRTFIIFHAKSTGHRMVLPKPRAIWILLECFFFLCVIACTLWLGSL